MRSQGTKDIASIVAVGTIAALYLRLLVLRPGGEGWGRGWNMVAFLFYGAPTAVLAAATVAWRRSKVEGPFRTVAVWAAVAGFIFPVVCLVAIMLRNA